MTISETTGRKGTYAKGVLRRQEILDRALDVFAVRGFEATSLRSIGEAIGVSHAALKHYFPSLEALLLEVLNERESSTTTALLTERSVMDAISEAAELNSKVPGVIALQTALLATSIEDGNQLSKKFFTDRFSLGRDALAALIGDERRKSARPEGTEEERRAIASLIMAAFDGLQIQWLLDRDVNIAQTLQLFEKLVRP